ncbi:D-alanyl-D-alanine carboxypeptidase [Candidatus Uhrbacteria bacterium]|nr:D-alanyl-D-alanine carboxypeptidase [Candidatus Uhrbacteria bacterium]
MRRFFPLILILFISGGIGVGLFFISASYPLASPLRAESGTAIPERVPPEVRVESQRVTLPSIGPQLKNTAKAVPLVTAERAVIVDGATGVVLFGKEEQTRTPIASLTKLITALVVLDRNPDWGKRMVMTAQDDRAGGTLFVRRGEEVTVRDLFFTSLVGSANNATVALARSTDLSREEFVDAMNAMARRIGLHDTVFVEPTGLDPGNQSTAHDIARLAWHAFQDASIREAVTTEEYVFRTANTRVRHRIKNTDILLHANGKSYTIIGGKTGYIDEAGFCLVVEAEEGPRRVIALVLGSKSHEDRFRDVDALIRWALESYQWDEGTEERKNERT